MNQSYLKIKNLTKEFLSEYQEEKVIAVKNFNLEIETGRVRDASRTFRLRQDDDLKDDRRL